MNIISLCFCLIVSLNSFAEAIYIRASEKLAAERAAPRPRIEISILDIKNHYTNILKTRPLNEHEIQLQNLNFVANELKVQKYTVYNKDPGAAELQTYKDAIDKKIKENPNWDKSLSPDSEKKIKPYMELIKKSFNEKSYGWAWFLKQLGNKAEAKKILLSVYEDNYLSVMGMNELRFDGTSPLSDVQFVQKALIPMLDPKDTKAIELKMQKMKNHFSNLPASNIKT